MKKIQPGDWVYSYSKGIYRVEKIVPRYYDEADIVDEEKAKVGDRFPDDIIVSKRLLSSTLKKSFGYDSCSDFFVSPLSREHKKIVSGFLKKNPSWIGDLDKYEIPPLKTIYNMNLILKKKSDVQKMSKFLSFFDRGCTFFEIKSEMTRRGLDKYETDNSGNYVLQFVNIDHEQKKKRNIWRQAGLLKF